ncbi:MAG: hypothetical protein IPI81_17475 [Flavobacteriales bacterium]|nr:hypothetical protein [Flavobacteriales bacterium]
MKRDPHLVPVFPELFAERSCPACGASDPKAVDVVFPGIHVFGEYTCTTCGYHFYHDLPVGFAVDHDVAIGKEEGRLYDGDGAKQWLTDPLMKGFRAPSDEHVPIERKVITPHKRVMVLNALDFLYGHVLLKMWNAQYYLDHHSDLGLVLILPKSFEWQVPKGVAEVWLVDQKLGKAHGWYHSINEQVKSFLTDFEEVYLAKGYAHPDKSKVDIERFTGVKAFDLDRFTTAPKHVTFVLREDRLWFRTSLHKLKYRALQWLGLKAMAQAYFLWDQQCMAMKALRLIRKLHPEVTASIVGLGERRSVPSGVEDLRTRRMDKETELTWCRAYAKSQLVIGVHGSNMLLPTAFAAGCIEILPHDRFENLAQDVAVRYTDVMQLFLYRFVDEFASSRTVARHAVSMFSDYPTFHRNNRVNVP